MLIIILMSPLSYSGTGKSSIVCAMCLGLGGHPKLLGRAKEVRIIRKAGHNFIPASACMGPSQRLHGLFLQLQREAVWLLR